MFNNRLWSFLIAECWRGGDQCTTFIVNLCRASGCDGRRVHVWKFATRASRLTGSWCHGREILSHVISFALFSSLYSLEFDHHRWGDFVFFIWEWIIYAYWINFCWWEVSYILGFLLVRRFSYDERLPYVQRFLY